MVVALRVSPPVKGKPPNLNMLELVTEVNSRYSKNKLRRRLLPQAYCYVCSRIDPSGIFRNPNSYLFRKGFLHACEHFPKAPYTTFIRDDEKHDDDHKDSAGCVTNPTAAPSISVTIKQSSEPLSQHGSSLQKERTFGSSVEKHSAIEGNDPERQKLSGSITRLPPLSSRNLKTSTGTAKTSDKLTEIATRLSGQHHSEDGIVDITPSVTIIPYGQGDEFSESQSKITELSTLTKGTTPSKSTNDLDSKPFSHANVTSSYTTRTEPGADLGSALQTKPYINESDGLDVSYAADPLLRDSASLESYRGNRAQRPKAGRARDRGQATEALPRRPESGHLRYHHRLDDDSVPYPGFEIPPTPSEEETLSIITAELERQEAERKLIEQQIADGNVFAGSSTGYADSCVSDETFRFSDAASRSKRRSKTQSGYSSKRSFCRCTSGPREQSCSENACQTCGKPLRHGSSTCSGRNRSTVSRSEKDGPPPTSRRSVTIKSRQNVLRESRRMKSKTVTDEDYMDLESIIHEDDGRYFSSDDDEFPHHFDHSPETFEKYRRLRGQPIVDPDLHKIVYLRALQETQLRKSQKVPRDFDELEDIQNIRRPPVFSYFEVWPCAPGKRLEPIGIRPPEPVKVKRGQFMKHIFGDVNMDDFYPVATKANAKPNASKRVSGRSRRILPEVPKDKVVSSVSLRLSKSDIKIEDK